MVEFKDLARVTIFGSREKNGVSFEPARDIPSLTGKVILITGGLGDLGRRAAIELARHGRPARIYIADVPRSSEAKQDILDQINQEVREIPESNVSDAKTDTEFRLLDLDLTSFDSVRACAAEFNAMEQRLDILLLNAGIIRVALGTTREGYEVHFGLNYLGHALLSKLLLATMLRTAEQQTAARLVVVSSEGHAMVPKNGIQFDKLKTECSQMSYLHRYGQSKLALIALVRELGRRHPQLTTAAVHPGRIAGAMGLSLAKESLLVRLSAPLAPLICVPVQVGVKNHLWAATSPLVVSGKYYEPVGVPDRESALAKDDNLSKRLWEWTETELEGIAL
ncbi:hypothetical protein PFICI_12269 [Pestalotiopsis fici W106-1]|uniref:Uncharacterized protein n=1 Tax=Pestalotiopsis fici (strain W106-1 / CGMCC3.15140) TaxID=1229662 RepID=W3WN38_PESFW|nr:uncharacterized protein PFICI_12269 [Pestalotiopsis fici W106-1]ETS75325.1 hypothetical protein PFICI_12269 [Pestalotiopsis fici W106-1]